MGGKLDWVIDDVVKGGRGDGVDLCAPVVQFCQRGPGLVGWLSPPRRAVNLGVRDRQQNRGRTSTLFLSVWGSATRIWERKTYRFMSGVWTLHSHGSTTNVVGAS